VAVPGTFSMSKRQERQDHHHLFKRNKRLKKEARILPWKDEWELESVGMALTTLSAHGDHTNTNTNTNTDTNDDMQQGMTTSQALAQVAVWKAKSSLERLPHAIESTAALAQVSLRDFMSRRYYSRAAGSSSCTVTELRLAYSAAITRTINGFADVLQQQRFQAASVSVLCGQIGIPSWLVDVRHEASHNSLPTLGVLRLAAGTLLEFLHSEYWIPISDSRRGWNTNDNKNNNNKEQSLHTQQQQQLQRQAAEYLTQYKSASTSTYITVETKTVAGDSASSSSSKRKKSQSPTPKLPPKATMTGPLLESSSEDEDGDWDDPIMGNIWGSAVGTDSNRFVALLEHGKPKLPNKATTTTKKTKKKKAPRTEKTCTDHAKDFAQHVPVHLGYSTALMFLVWGGAGGAPSGRGVLIPGSAIAFPASLQGVAKVRDRYAPLIQVLSKAWPGFAYALLVHVVDFILSLEEQAAESSSAAAMDIGSARKLYFLSSWVRFLLSERFLGEVDPNFVVEKGKKKTKKNSNLADIPLAPLSSLVQTMQYPLNSLHDRCDLHADNETLGLRKTSRVVLQLLEEILGDERVANYGFDKSFLRAPVPVPESIVDECQSPSTGSTDETPQTPTKRSTEKELTNEADSTLCLAEMEAMLVDEEAKIEAKEGSQHKRARPNEKRPAWVQCASWDPCSLGTLPGYPV
jgi:ribosomal biogenesis protein LAS1